MEAGFVVIILLTAIIFTMVGMYIGKRKASRQNVQGILNVDCRDPESSPYLFLQLEVPVEDVIGKQQIVFDVHTIR
jgi:hypothetical protein